MLQKKSTQMAKKRRIPSHERVLYLELRLFDYTKQQEGGFFCVLVYSLQKRMQLSATNYSLVWTLGSHPVSSPGLSEKKVDNDRFSSVRRTLRDSPSAKNPKNPTTQKKNTTRDIRHRHYSIEKRC
jgi:hypothetical protein